MYPRMLSEEEKQWLAATHPKEYEEALLNEAEVERVSENLIVATSLLGTDIPGIYALNVEFVLTYNDAGVTEEDQRLATRYIVERRVAAGASWTIIQ